MSQSTKPPRKHEQEMGQAAEDGSRRIHVLGVGNVGTFIAHSLAGIPNRPPLTLLLRRWERLRDYRAKGSALRLTTNNTTETRHGFEVEAPKLPTSDPIQSIPLPLAGYSENFGDRSKLSEADPENSRPSWYDKPSNDKGNTGSENSNKTKSRTPSSLSERQQPSDTHQSFGLDSNYPESDNGMLYDDILDKNHNAFDGESDPSQVDDQESAGFILHLVVTVKAHHTVNALRSYAHRLNSQSTILFLQNGMGMIDELNKGIFPHEATRPHYMVGILSHGLYGRGPFDVVHAGDGTIALGLLTGEKDYPPSSRYLLRTMTRTPVFVAVGFTPTDIVQQQLDKLAVNAVVNPLTAILDCFNGQILDNFFMTRVMRLLIAEISVVFRSLPELKSLPNVKMRFSSARLESLVVKVAQLTGQNRSSMLQDVQNGRQTEIDYITGYIVRRGEELGIHCVTNYMLMQMVKAKDKMNEEERGGVLPMQPSIKSR